MNKTTEIISLLLESANRANENGLKLIGRSEGIRDVVNFIKTNNLEIIGPGKQPTDDKK